MRHLPTIAALAVGLAIVVYTGMSVVDTLLRPGAPRSRLTHVVMRLVVLIFTAGAQLLPKGRRKGWWSWAGPFVLVGQLATWWTVMTAGWALALWPAMDERLWSVWRLHDLGTAVRETGSSMLTLGTHWTPGIWPAIVDLTSGLMGFALMTLFIAYLPTLHAAYVERQTATAALELRPGGPPWGPQLLVALERDTQLDGADRFFAEWERVGLSMIDHHIRYPMLQLFHSSRSGRSWVTALTAVTDAALLKIHLLEDDAVHSPASRVARIGSECLQAIAEASWYLEGTRERPSHHGGLSRGQIDQGVEVLARAGHPIPADDPRWASFLTARNAYAPAIEVLAQAHGEAGSPWCTSTRHAE
ncbi:MAG: hypothetical protein LWW86_02460 [Micrococcales bacterium]|nr:hypothetical protein [Micrococcales bacterium]